MNDKMFILSNETHYTNQEELCSQGKALLKIKVLPSAEGNF